MHFLYRLFCNNCNQYKYIWKEDTELPPNECFDNEDHTINSDITVISELAEEIIDD